MGVKGRLQIGEAKETKQVELSLHKRITIKASKWLQKHERNLSIPNCPHIAIELVTPTITGEVPDVIGWCYWTNVLIEVKVSRNDFFADAKKAFRLVSEEGVGEFRYYCCPAGLIKNIEVPDSWGLLYLNHKGKIEIIKVAERQEANLTCERGILLSMLRRKRKSEK